MFCIQQYYRKNITTHISNILINISKQHIFNHISEINIFNIL